MEITKSSKVNIVGVGNVGMSIVQAFAQSGFQICGVDIEKQKLENGLNKVNRNLDKLVEKSKIKSEDKDAILSRIQLATDYEYIKDADVVIEAVFEDIDVKKELFKKIDNIIENDNALLLTNTSSLSISEIASVTTNPDKVAGMHFFNPVPIMKLVEVVRGILTSNNTIYKVKELAKLMEKTPIESYDSPGFIVNRMLNALVVEASRIVEEGVASVEDVDTGAKLGLGHPMGPFELFDYLNGIGLLKRVTDYMSSELGDRFNLPVWVKNLVRANKLGRDSGKGFYNYS